MKQSFKNSLSLILIFLMTSGSTLLYAQTNYNLTVQSGGRQSLKGFGASQTGLPNAPAGIIDQMSEMVYGDLKANILRLWLGTGSGVTVSAMKTAFYNQYVNNGVISKIQSKAPGVTTLLLGPALGHVQPTEPINEYSAKIAQFILDVKNEKGIVIDVTGIANEPAEWTPELMVDAAKYLRIELDNRGLNYVKIIAPETASNDGDLNKKLDALYNDPQAWNSIDAISSHSYNMAATEAQVNRTYGKDFWITEASNNGNEVAEYENLACIAAARFLNDMNHSVTHWVWFIGYSSSNNVITDNDNATKLMVYDRATSKMFIHLKYYYFKQMLEAFDVGAVFRRVHSATEADMPYSHGQKPAINAAAAINPDGTWSIGIVNDTDVPTSNSNLTRWYPATTYNVNVKINELSGSGSRTFNLYRSSANNHIVHAGTVDVINGNFTVMISPKELVTLRSVNAPKASAIIWPDIPDNLRNTNGWRGDTIPRFNPEHTNYTITLPDSTKKIPVLFPLAMDINATIDMKYATSLTGNEEERTTVFTITSGDDLAMHYYIKFELADSDTIQPSTISSEHYIISPGNSGLQSIIGVDTSITADFFYSFIIKKDPAQTLELHSVTDGSIKTSVDVVSDNDTLVVFSPDNQKITRYLITVTEGGFSSDAVLSSSVYTINFNDSTGTISGMSYGNSISEVLDNIMQPASATLFVIDNNNALVPLKKLNYGNDMVSTSVHDSIYLKVIAQDGKTIITYDLEPASSPFDAFVNSDVYEVNQENRYIRFIPSGTNISTLFKNIIPAKGASVVVTDTIGFQRNTGNIELNYKLKVTSSDGSVTNSYLLILLESVINSNVYIVSNGNEGLQSVNGVDTTTTLENFLNNIIKSDPDLNLEVHTASNGTVLNPEDIISDNDTLIVTSGGNQTITKYLITVLAGGLSSDAILTSSIYDIVTDENDGKGIISSVKFGASIEEVLSDINIPSNAVLHVIDQNANAVALQLMRIDSIIVSTSVYDSIRFLVVAQNRKTSILYTIKTDTATSDAFVVSDQYEVDQDELKIRLIIFGTSVSACLNNIIPCSGSTMKILNNLNIPQSEGNIGPEYKLEVTSADESNTVIYELIINGGEAYVKSTILTVDQNSKIISGVSPGMQVDEFTDVLIIAQGATIKIIDKYIRVKTSGSMEIGDILMVISANGKLIVEYELDFLISTDLTAIKNDIKIYPNPAASRIFIEGLNDDHRIEITNVLGNKVFEGKYEDGISLADLSSGVYILQIRDKNGTLHYFTKILKK